MDYDKKDVPDVLKAAEVVKGLGNEYVKKQSWELALKKYQKVQSLSCLCFAYLFDRHCAMWTLSRSALQMRSANR